MAAPTLPTDRTTFKQYCLRRLGAGVITINTSDDQVEDRINDALAYMQDYGVDATERTFISHKITGSTMTCDANSSFSVFSNSEAIHGQTSNAFGQIFTIQNTSTIIFRTSNGTFANNETVVGVGSGATANVVSITLGDVDNRFIQMDPRVISISRILNPFASQWQSRNELLFNLNYQLRAADLWSLQSTSMIPYWMARRHLQQIDEILTGLFEIRYQRYGQKLFIDWDWANYAKIDSFILFEGYVILDPDASAGFWSDRWLRELATAYIKRQWGMNISKYGSIQLPGGVTLDTQTILQEANKDVERLEAAIRLAGEMPPMPIIG